MRRLSNQCLAELGLQKKCNISIFGGGSSVDVTQWLNYKAGWKSLEHISNAPTKPEQPSTECMYHVYQLPPNKEINQDLPVQKESEKAGTLKGHR